MHMTLVQKYSSFIQYIVDGSNACDSIVDSSKISDVLCNIQTFVENFKAVGKFLFGISTCYDLSNIFRGSVGGKSDFALVFCFPKPNHGVSVLTTAGKVMLDRDTGRPRGFGFVTFSDQRAMDDAITDMHGQELGGRVISVNKAEPKLGSDGPDRGYRSGGGGYSSGPRGSYRAGGADRPPPSGKSDCFKCGRPGHWARDCPSSGGGGGDRFSSRPRPGSGGGARGDRFGASDRYDDRYIDDRYDGGRYGDRDRLDSRDDRYSGGRDRYNNDRYPANGDRLPGDRYGASDYPPNGYSKERGYDRDAVLPVAGSERYAGGAPARYEGGGGGGYRERPAPYDRPTRGAGGYRERPGPYDRPSRGGRASAFDDRY